MGDAEKSHLGELKRKKTLSMWVFFKSTPDAIPNRMCLSIWNAKATDEGARLTLHFFK